MGWKVLAYGILDILTELELTPLPEEPQHLLTEGNEGQHEHRHKVKPDNAMQSIKRGTSLQANGIERKKARSSKREQETTIITWEKES